jgi:hypothetical protein
MLSRRGTSPSAYTPTARGRADWRGQHLLLIFVELIVPLIRASVRSCSTAYARKVARVSLVGACACEGPADPRRGRTR